MPSARDLAPACLLAIAACTNGAPAAAPAPAPAASSSGRAAELPGVPVDAAADASSDAAMASAPVDAGPATATASDEPPRVKVVSIGMHVAGGPYDEATKKPFLRAVEPHYADLARCWKHVSEPRQADVGVDLLIPAAGGKPRVSNPRCTVPTSDAFLPCVVAFFEGVEFDKPARGAAQGVSYSVRFKPVVH